MQQMISFQQHIYETASLTQGTIGRTAAIYSIYSEQDMVQLKALISQCLELLFHDQLISTELFVNWVDNNWQTPADHDNPQEIKLTLAAQPTKTLQVSFPGWCCDAQSLIVFGHALHEFLDSGSLPHVMNYQKYTYWQQSNLEPDDCIFWNNYLNSEQAPHPLPFNNHHNRQALLGFTDITLDLDSIPSAMSNPQIIQALWYGLLSRLSLDGNTSMGIVTDGRVLPQFTSSLGLYALIVPVNIELATTDTLQQIAQKLEAYLEHHSDAQIAVPPNTSWTQAPAHSFQILSQPAKNQLKVELKDVWTHLGIFDSQCLCLLTQQQLILRLYYNQASYHADAMDQLLGIFATQLRASDENSKIMQLPLFTPAQHAQPIRNNTTDVKTLDQSKPTVVDLIQQWFDTSPDNIAVEDDKNHCCYAEFERLSRNICMSLVDPRHGPKKVALLMENSIALVQTVYAVLRAGHAIVPVDPTQLTGRELFILNECDFAVVDKVGTQVLVQSDIALSSFDYDDLIATDVDQIDYPPVKPETIASVIYTSGTTGHPKGTLVSHQNLLSYLNSVKDLYLRNTKRALVHTPISFDMAHTSFFLPLIKGGTITMVATDNSLEALINTLNKQTTPFLLKLTPSHLLAMKSWFEQIHTSYHHLDTVVIGGEQLRSTDLRLLFQKMPQTRVFNEYGPTETTVGVTVYETPIEDIGPIPIGEPLAHVDVFILDVQGYPLAPGMIGELYIGGSSVTQGYLNQPELTQTRFIDAPTHLDYSGKLYKTGDLVYLCAQSRQLTFVRRNDSQLKLRGYRIEKQEIINCLIRLDQVQSAQLVIIEQNHTVQLVAFVTGPQLNATDSLSQQLQQQLPNYMQPNRLYILPRLPLNPNGKVDEAALIAHDLEASQKRSTQVVPANTPLEAKLIDIWQEALDIETIGITDNFFDVGGDSIRAIYISSVAKGKGYNIKVQDIMQYPTISELAPIIKETHIDIDTLQTLSDEDLISKVEEMNIDDVDQLLEQLE